MVSPEGDFSIKVSTRDKGGGGKRFACLFPFRLFPLSQSNFAIQKNERRTKPLSNFFDGVFCESDTFPLCAPSISDRTRKIAIRPSKVARGKRALFSHEIGFGQVEGKD